MLRRIIVPTPLGSSSPRKVTLLGLLDPEDEGTMFVRNVVTLYPTTWLNIPEELNLPKQPL
jgi:hypothetical protein